MSHFDSALIAFRPVDEADAVAISELITCLCERFIIDAFPEEGKSNMLLACTPAAIAKCINDGFDYEVATANGEIIGVVATRDNSHLYHLFVREQWHGRGLASALWHRAKSRCIMRGHRGPFSVNASTNAVGLYERLGFVPSASQRGVGGVTFYPMLAAL